MSHLRQILINLTSNAIKYTEKGSVMLRVLLGSHGADSARMRFEITDTGVGIPGDRFAYIFEPFTQLPQAASRGQGGTGLGLAICKQLVEKMGGEIGLASERGEGSTFWFEVTLARPAGETSSGERGPMSGIRALVVDDNSINREILRHQLAALGVTHDEAEDGERAMELMQAAASAGRGFDVVVLDDRMPYMSGIELAGAIRRDDNLGKPPLIMLSSMGDEHESVEAGIDYFLTRPVRQSQLHDCLVTALRAKIDTAVARSPRSSPAPLAARVLVVEDNAVNQELALNMLEFLGCSCTIARHGREALALLERQKFDAVLMDCQMPEMDGFEATAAIRLRESSANREERMPIIALTAGAVEGDRDKCLAAGMDDYLSKPFSVEQLEGVLRRWVPAGTASSAKRHVEEEAIARMLVLGGGRPAILQKMVRIYLQDAAERLAEIRDGMTNADATQVARAAHSFKSGSANMGAAALAELCQQLERQCRAGATAGAETLAREIETEFVAVAADLSHRARETAT
jgi:CheY-like chemotaxis protein